MRLYKTKNGIIAEEKDIFYEIIDVEWDELINDDDLYDTLKEKITHSHQVGKDALTDLLAPIGSSQELWACGVTYLRSKIGRQEESKDAGGGDFYAKVYEAERPEVFFKSNPHRISYPGGLVEIRSDSTWDVPEPELTLVVTSSGRIVGYTIGNDMSSRSIEGENPLYLPQAKTYDGCASLGPCIYVTREHLSPNTIISLRIDRDETKVFEGSIELGQMKRSVSELVSFVYRACSFPNGCLVMTGTGIVPPNDFTLKGGDIISITIGPIGTLTNTVG